MDRIPITAEAPADARPWQAAVCTACEVRREALFGVLDEHALDRLHQRIGQPWLPADRVLYRAGDAGASVYTVRAGVLRFERVTAQGERRVVRLAGRGDLIGQEALLQRPYGDDAIACTPVDLCRLPVALVDGLHDDPGGSRVPRELMSRWQGALDDAAAWVAELSTGPARRRLLHLLRRLDALADPQGLAWLPRRELIGAMLDVTLETASRSLSDLRRAGVVTLHDRRHMRVDRARLEQALHEQP